MVAFICHKCKSTPSPPRDLESSATPGLQLCPPLDPTQLPPCPQVDPRLKLEPQEAPKPELSPEAATCSVGTHIGPQGSSVCSGGPPALMPQGQASSHPMAPSPPRTSWGRPLHRGGVQTLQPGARARLYGLPMSLWIHTPACPPQTCGHRGTLPLTHT